MTVYFRRLNANKLASIKAAGRPLRTGASSFVYYLYTDASDEVFNREISAHDVYIRAPKRSHSVLDCDSRCRRMCLDCSSLKMKRIDEFFIGGNGESNKLILVGCRRRPCCVCIFFFLACFGYF